MRVSVRQVFLVTAVVTAMIGSVTVAQASMPTLTSPTGPDSGDLSTSPSTFFKGDTITIIANFADGQSGKVITFYKETSPGSGDFDSVGTKTASSSGNGSLTGYTINATQKVFARTSAGKETEVDTLTPRAVSGTDGLISACADRDDGELSLLFAPACSSSEKLLTWNAQGIKGEKGDTGEKGEKGDKGDTGATGPAGGGLAFFARDGSDRSFLAPTTVVSKALPAGKYVFTASVTVQNRGTTGTRRGSCSLVNGTFFQLMPLPEADESGVPIFEDYEFTILGTFDAGGGGTLTMTCSAFPDDTLWATQASILATKVDSIG